MYYRFNKEKLLFEKTYKVLKYKIVSIILLLCLSGTLLSAITLKSKADVLKQIVKEKEKRISLIKQPLREETYVKDLYNSIGFKLTPKQYKTFERLSLKYKNKIEEAKVPATLVWWIGYKESRFNPEATNKESSAKGQFQFLDGTWNTMCKLKGVSKQGRFDEEKQVDILLTYLNYLYNKYGNWSDSMKEYHGGEYQYPVTFLFK
jgi:hypothetical protein